jgi:hypothetical protein
MQRTRRILLLTVCLILWMALSACSCGNLTSLLSRRTADVPTLSPQRAQPETPVPTRQVPTALPQQPTRAIPATPDIEELLPEGANQSVEVEITEEQLNEYLQGQTFTAEGAQLEDIKATITAQDILVTFTALYAPLNLNAGVTMRGKPVVADGQAYIQVEDIALDSSVPAFTRMLAQVAIEQALAAYTTENGIPIPVERLEVEAVRLEQGKIMIKGITRAE